MKLAGNVLWVQMSNAVEPDQEQLLVASRLGETTAFMMNLVGR